MMWLPRALLSLVTLLYFLKSFKYKYCETSLRYIKNNNPARKLQIQLFQFYFQISQLYFYIIKRYKIPIKKWFVYELLHFLVI